MATGIQLVLGITGTGKNRVSETQSILFDKSQYTVGQARQWLQSHGYKDGEPDITKGKLRFRQQAPGKFREFATKGIGNPTYRELVYTLRIGESLDEAKQAADVMASRFGWDVIIMSTNKKEVLYKASATKGIGNPIPPGYEYFEQATEDYKKQIAPYLGKLTVVDDGEKFVLTGVNYAGVLYWSKPKQKKQFVLDYTVKDLPRLLGNPSRNDAYGIFSVPKSVLYPPGFKWDDSAPSSGRGRARSKAKPPSQQVKRVATHKGYAIYQDRETGEFGTNAERESRFDSKKDAQRFIDSLVKGRNPSNPMSIYLFVVYKGKVYFKRSDRKDSHAAWFKQLGIPSNEFDRVTRGRVGILTRDKTVVFFTYEGTLTSLSGQYIPTPNNVVDKFISSYPKYSSYDLADGYSLRNPSIGVEDLATKVGITINRRNPDNLAKATELSKQFHGREPNEIIDITEPDTQRTDYALLGELKELEIVDGPKSVIPITFSTAAKNLCVYLAASPSGEQLYLIGGDQFLDLSDFDYLTDTERKKDKVELGLLHSVTYHTDKHHLEGPATQRTGEDYFHVFASPVEGAGDGEKPVLIYDRLNERMEIAGGSYCVKDVGIVG